MQFFPLVKYFLNFVKYRKTSLLIPDIKSRTKKSAWDLVPGIN